MSNDNKVRKKGSSKTGCALELKMAVNGFHRSRIAQEDMLIVQRVLWMIFSETFFTALWGTVVSKVAGSTFGIGRTLIDQNVYNVIVAMPIAGMSVAFFSFVAICAAFFEITHICYLYRSGFRRVNVDRRLPKLVGSGANHFIGALLPPILAAIFGILQFYIFIFTRSEFQVISN